MIRVLIALTMLMILTSTASSSETSFFFLRGNELMSLCKNQELLEAHTQYASDDFNKCLGYIMAISDEMDLQGMLGDTNGVTAGQEVKIVLKYGNDHPEQLNRHAAWIVDQALRKAFPK